MALEEMLDYRNGTTAALVYSLVLPVHAMQRDTIFFFITYRIILLIMERLPLPVLLVSNSIQTPH